MKLKKKAFNEHYDDETKLNKKKHKNVKYRRSKRLMKRIIGIAIKKKRKAQLSKGQYGFDWIVLKENKYQIIQNSRLKITMEKINKKRNELKEEGKIYNDQSKSRI
jgi:hypothetical protein